MVKKKLNIIWDNEAKRPYGIFTITSRAENLLTLPKKVRNAIFSQAQSLNDFPEKFEREHLLKDEQGNYHYKVIWSYKIIYEVTKEAIYVLDKFHTSRDPSNIKN